MFISLSYVRAGKKRDSRVTKIWSFNVLGKGGLGRIVPQVKRAIYKLRTVFKYVID